MIEGDRLKIRNYNEISCEEVQALIFEYIDGELDSREAARVSAHFMKCPKCRKEADECRSMLSEIGKLEYPIPSELHRNVMALVGSTPQDKPSRFKKLLGGAGSWRAAIGTLTAACAVVAIVVLSRGGGYDTMSAEAADELYGNVGAASRVDAFGISETVGALSFSSPMTSAVTEAVEYSTVVLEDKPVNEIEEFEDHKLENVTSYDETVIDRTMVEVDLTQTAIDASAESFDKVIYDLVEAGTAVMILPSDSQVGAEDGDEIKLAGYEENSFREVYGEELAQKLDEYTEELDSDKVEYSLFCPEGEFDCVLLVYGAPDGIN